MVDFDDILNLLILYDTARGFLPLREAEEIVHHAMLSFTGAAGTRHVHFFEHAADGSFRLASPRDEAVDGSVEFRVEPETLALFLRDPGALPLEGLRRGEEALADAARELNLSLIVPVVDANRIHGLVGVGEKLLGESHTDTELSLLHEIAGLMAVALARESVSVVDAGSGRAERGASLDEIRRAHPPLSRIAGNSSGTRMLLDEILTLADFDLPVLITGETGTGKELVARALHEIGPRASGPFEAVNCAAIPRELVSSHLFGHEKGAFTGAIAGSRGAFERAGDGTLFLDEIGDMPLDVQASLLRVLQERRYSRVGGERSLLANARILSATNRNLEEAVAAGTFRADLFYRIQMYSLRLLPLRERREDIPPIVDYVLAGVRRVRGLAPEASRHFLEILSSLPLKGNVRELEGLIMSSVVRAGASASLEPEHLMLSLARTDAPLLAANFHDVSRSDPGHSRDAGGEAATTAPRVLPYEEMERDYIRSVLRLTEGNKKQAAAMMGIPRSTLSDRMKKLGLDPGS